MIRDPKKEDYWGHLSARLQRDHKARDVRSRYSIVFEGWLTEAQRLNGGEFAWEVRHEWKDDARA